MKRALVFAALLVACGDSNRHSNQPVAMTIKPVGTNEVPPTTTGPAEPEPAEAPLQIAFVASRLCIRTDGKVYCQAGGALEPPLVQEKFRVDGVDDAIDLAGGRSLTCVVTRRGTVMCSGSNHYGEVGARSADDRIDKLVEVAGISHARRVVTTGNHACAILDDKTVKCWGRNDHGQTGGDTYYHPEARELVTPNLVPNVKTDNMAAGSESSCARTLERQVVCWGMQQDQSQAMKSGQWKNERPTRMPDLDDMTALYGHEEGYCGLRRGQVLCWGNARRLIPGTDYFGGGIVSVADLKDVQQLGLSDGHACALHADGRVSCFGYPYTGALGRAQPTDPQKQYDPAAPALVEGLPRAKFVAVGGTGSCALTANNDLYFWGRWYTDGGPHDEPKPIPIQIR